MFVPHRITGQQKAPEGDIQNQDVHTALLASAGRSGTHILALGPP